ncbi:MAG: hypothetical protein IJO21_03020 [Oscillospiraceae bacterium]|nr:hypothetical protein [Oscillospiraceae bacterium]MBQ7129999.1 hypothetical protein [Oscillospiraceae bacterium]
MSILDKIKNLPNNLIEALKQAYESDDTDIRIEKTIASGVKITIRVRPSAETIDLEGLTLEELTGILEELEQKQGIVQADKPEDDDSKEHEEWEDIVEDLEDQIDTVQEAIDALDDEYED